MEYRPKGDAPPERIRARLVIGADGARSQVGRQAVPGADKVKCVFAYHEIVAAPDGEAPDYDAQRCDVYYQGRLSPDFYAWIFPHGETVSIGTGSMQKGFSLRGSVAELRRSAAASPPMPRRNASPRTIPPPSRSRASAS